MGCKNLHLLPIAVFVWFPGTFLLTYLIATLLGHVPFFLPYISDTGTFIPESCVFSQMVNLGLLQMASVMYIRYKQVSRLEQGASVLNKAALGMGLAASSGIDLVANFQVRNVFFVHLTGAIMGFGFGVAYLVLQTVITFRLHPMWGHKWLLFSRCCLACVSLICFVLCITCALVSYYLFTGKDIQKWSPEDGGWPYHVVSAFCEWTVAFAMVSYVLSFAPEFRYLSISEPQLLLQQTEWAPPLQPILHPCEVTECRLPAAPP